MKKITLILALLFTTSFSKSFVVNDKLKWTYLNETFNTISKKNISIYYDTEIDIFYLSFKSPISDIRFLFKTSDDYDLRHSIEKYKEWNKKASAKKVKITKVINQVDVPKAYFSQFNRFHTGFGSMKYLFNSHSTQTHNLAILGKLQSDSNQFSYTEIWIILTYSEANALHKALSPKSLSAYKIKAKKLENELVEFN
jgi:hypothetical protein